MRWVMLWLLLPLAGCIVDEPPREHRIYLLGLDPCHEGICWVDDQLGQFRHTLTITGLDTYEPAGNQDYFLQNGTLWGFDRETRELRHVANNIQQMLAESGAATFVEGGVVWQYDWHRSVRLAPPLGGPLTLLDVHAGAALVRVDRETSDLVLIDGDPQTVAVNAHSVLGALDAARGAYVEPAPDHDQAWMFQQDSTTPLWSSGKRIANIGLDANWLALDLVGDTPQIEVWAGRGSRPHSTVGGELVDVQDGILWYMEHGPLGPRTIAWWNLLYGFGAASQDVQGIAITAVHVGNHLTLVSDNMVLEAPLSSTVSCEPSCDVDVGAPS